MSGPATEICFLPLLDVTKIEDPSSDDYRVLQTTLQTLTAQDGFQKAYYGRQKENPNVLQLCIGKACSRRDLPHPYLPSPPHTLSVRKLDH